MKMCKKELFQFILQIIFGTIFDIDHGTLILCCTTTDLGIFGVAFVRALYANLCQLVSHHDTDSVRDLGLLCRNKMSDLKGLWWSMAPTVCTYISRSSHFRTNLALVPRGPATNSSRTATGVCRPRIK